MPISIEIAQALLAVDRSYGASSVVPLRQLCGDDFVDQAIELAKRRGDLGFFDQAVRQLARETIDPPIIQAPTIPKRKTIKSSIKAHIARNRKRQTKLGA